MMTAIGFFAAVVGFGLMTYFSKKYYYVNTMQYVSLFIFTAGAFMLFIGVTIKLWEAIP